MIPVLHIIRRAPGDYEVSTTNPDFECPQSFSTVSAALKFAGDDVPRDFALFVEVRYNGVCLGTRPLQQLAESPGAVADELMDLTARVLDAEDELQLARAKGGGQ
ncbi:hypothetical protein [Pseudorhodoferax sp.]|uniref:hypothetical protein n=1 Tax=Pseudorhodoferax sp. TaxID=1993553 RepID=UPI002DD66658|nr:hypothetical protein [Pseudorhodoferax sp.]